ncbi:MAG: copper amine oxidase [Clostridiales bacterium]|nr:copper amine oxidase [Clostridiales bacterium]
MKKIFLNRISMICAICLAVCIVSGFASADVNNVYIGRSSDYETVPLYINGIKMSDGFKVEDTTYITLREFFNVLDEQTDIAWDNETGTVNVTGDKLDLTATVGDRYMTVNGRCFYIPYGVLNIDGSVALPVRELAKIYQFDVSWDEAESSVCLSADNPSVIEDASSYYNEQDLYWLSRLINAEAGNQPLEGKIGVGNVVVNRVADPTCPDTVFGVIFDSKYGVQFSVTQTGGIYQEPNEESVIAAKICLEGYDIVGGSIYFVNPTVGATSWFTNTRVYMTTIGDHDFYA